MPACTSAAPPPPPPSAPAPRGSPLPRSGGPVFVKGAGPAEDVLVGVVSFAHTTACIAAPAGLASVASLRARQVRPPSLNAVYPSLDAALCEARPCALRPCGGPRSARQPGWACRGGCRCRVRPLAPKGRKHRGRRSPPGDNPPARMPHSAPTERRSQWIDGVLGGAPSCASDASRGCAICRPAPNQLDCATCANSTHTVVAGRCVAPGAPPPAPARSPPPPVAECPPPPPDGPPPPLQRPPPPPPPARRPPSPARRPPPPARRPPPPRPPAKRPPPPARRASPPPPRRPLRAG